MKAIVTTFDGSQLHITVTKVWEFKGKPDRIHGYDEAGNSYKFKMDEEPFELTPDTRAKP